VTYFLILLSFLNGHPTMQTLTFKSESACRLAKDFMSADIERPDKVFCVPEKLWDMNAS
jgi:hypothetical protein